MGKKGRVTNAAAGGEKADKRRGRWGIEKAVGGVERTADSWNNVTSSSSKKQMKFSPRCIQAACFLPGVIIQKTDPFTQRLTSQFQRHQQDDARTRGTTRQSESVKVKLLPH